MLLEQSTEPVNPSHSCEQPVEKVGTTPAKPPANLVIRWRGGGAPTVQPYVGHDVTFAFVMAEGMMGIRDGDTVTLYAVHWSACLWGRA